MNNLFLKCSLSRCNLDNTEQMSLEKCVLQEGGPCYYLLIQQNVPDPEQQAWERFDLMIRKQKGLTNEKQKKNLDK